MKSNHIILSVLFVLMVFFAFNIIGCGSSGGGDGGTTTSDSDNGTDGGGTSDDTSDDGISSSNGIVALVSASTGAESIVANSSSEASIISRITDTDGKNITDGTKVTFVTTAGEFKNASIESPQTIVVETKAGTASAMLIGSSNLGTATITISAGGFSSSTSVEFVAGPCEKLTIVASPTNLFVDEESSITVMAFDANDNPISGETLTFNASHGSFSNRTTTTTDGSATITYTAPNSVPDGDNNITVSATNGKSATVNISVQKIPEPPIVGIDLSSSLLSIPVEGATATISAVLTVSGGGYAPDGTEVNFTIQNGCFKQEEGCLEKKISTTVGGIATVTVQSSDIAGIGIVRAEAGGIIDEIELEYTPGSIDMIIVPNSILGTGQEESNITITLRDANGNIKTGEKVNFELDDLSLGSLLESEKITDDDGKAETTFSGSVDGGVCNITATWTTGNVDVTTSKEITILPPPAYIQIADNSPDPASINIKGTGGEATSFISFNVKDIYGNSVADGYRIDFAINSGPNGGENISPWSVKTLDGQVTTILRSGSKSGPVSIKAIYSHDTNVSTTTSQIAINAGHPVGEEFGISADYLNISGFWMANIEDVITINAGDVYGNAIPDETAISFKTYNTGGLFEPNIATTIDGFAYNNLHSAGTYLQPLQGFVSVTAETNDGGRSTSVTCLAVVPSNNHIIYAGTNGGGIYKSIDNGSTWQNISRSSDEGEQGQNWIDPYVNDIAINHNNPNIIYVATGRLGRGNIYRSLDGGINWNSNNAEEWSGIFNTNTAVLTVLCDDNNNSNQVWIGTDGSGALFSEDGKNFKWGGKVEDISFYGNPNNNTNNISNIELSSTSKTEDWTITYNKTGVIATTPVLDTSTSSSAADGAMIVNQPDIYTEATWVATYKGGYKDLLEPVGGKLTIVSTSVSTVEEKWTVICKDEGGTKTFEVIGSLSGMNKPAKLNENYTTDKEEVTFYITETNGFSEDDKFTFITKKDSWEVKQGNEQQGTAKTDELYTSDNGEISFIITSGNSYFYKEGDFWSFETKLAELIGIGNWVIDGSVSGTQAKRAENNLTYSSDSNEIIFKITKGSESFVEGDKFTFKVTASGLGHGISVRDIVKSSNGDLYAATATGVFKSNDQGIIWSKYGDSFVGEYINTIAVTENDVVYAGTKDAGVWSRKDDSSDWKSHWEGMGKGLSATVPIANPNNKGNGIISNVTVFPDTLSEDWTVKTDDGTVFSVTGSISGEQTCKNENNTYTIENVLSFDISEGSINFEKDDTFTFSTTRDLGREIKDIIVVKDDLYAITYFDGPLEPHTVGNVYVHELDPNDRTMKLNADETSNWTEVNNGLPQYDPPGDTTIFAQRVMAVDNPDNPEAIYIGGEGIHLYKAELNATTFKWLPSESGLTNLIMARMPILFSGECTMDIEKMQSDNIVTFIVYIQDVNGNPPIVGSIFEVVQIIGTESTVLLRVEYPDTYTYQGTRRDPFDPETNNPYVITAYAVGTIEFTFTPTCEDEAPGCSGSDQEIAYSF